MAIKISGTTVIDDSRNIQNIGVATATTFSGNLTGNVTGNATGLSGTPNLNVGIVTATSFIGDGSSLSNTGATLSAGSGSQRLVVTSSTSGIMTTAATDADLTWNSTTNTLSATNVSIAGTLTYEDVTNVDSIGIVTARTGAHIATLSGNLLVGSTSATGTSSQPLQVTGGAYVSGNLGVGATNPGAKLDVAGDIRLSAADAEIEFNNGGPRLKGRTNAFSIHTGGGLDSEASEQVRINTTGVGIGNTNPSYKLDVSGVVRLGNGVAQGAPSSTNILTNAHTILSGEGGNYLTIGQYGVSSSYAQWIQSAFSNPTTATYNIVLQPLGGNVGIATSSPTEKLHVIGNILASGNVSGYSDIRLKNNIQTIPNALDKVSKLRGVEFDRNDIEENPHQIGVIAQEVEEIIPEVVTTHSDGIKSVSYGNLVGLLIEAIKDLKEEVNELKAKLEEI